MGLYQSPLRKPSVSHCLKCVLQASLLGGNTALYRPMSFLLPIPNSNQWQHRKTSFTCTFPSARKDAALPAQIHSQLSIPSYAKYAPHVISMRIT